MNLHSRTPVLAPVALLACLVAAACSPKAPETAAAPATPAQPEPAPERLGIDAGTYALVTIPVGKLVPADYPAQIAAWKAAGQVEGVILLQKHGKQLAETGAKSAGFESLAVVEFPSEAGYTAWAAQSAPKLGADAVVRRADVLAYDAVAERDAGKAYYAVNHYEALIPAQDYKTYTQTYIVPNMGNQKDAGVMTSYTMFLEREPAGTKPKAVLVKEYLDEDAFARSEAIKEAHKPVLLADPEWKRINDTKTTMRTDLNETLARQVVLQ